MKAGGCFCGAIRYELLSDDYPVINCHCTMCRRASGAPFVSWLVVPEADFRLTTGTPRLRQSSAHGTRGFCPDCGTQVTCISTAHASIVDITLGSLDAPESLVPGGDIFTDTRLPWVPLGKSH
jgi:hypothetical protein